MNKLKEETPLWAYIPWIILAVLFLLFLSSYSGGGSDYEADPTVCYGPPQTCY